MGTLIAARGITTILVAIVVLAGLDFAAALFAKEWAEHRQIWMFVAGLLTFVLLYFVYAFSLQIAELTVISFGWIVMFQVGLLVLDRLRYGIQLSGGKWLAVAAIMVLQTYLMLGPSAGQSS